MGKNKKKTSNNLGRSLVKDRFGGTSNKKIAGDSLLHTSEINDGYDWGRLNLQSVTEESSFQEFLSTAELAGTEFQAEKLNITFVTPSTGLLSKTERSKLEAQHTENRDLLRIPRRPAWDASTSAEQLQEQERTSFLKWRHDLAMLQEEQGFVLTPYEKNLEFWRQLWRVVERSDVVVQIVDARNPLLFRCEDLEAYVKEVDPSKLNLLLLNKADLLSEQQREKWTEYFNQHHIRVAFFSAILEDIKEDDEDIDSSHGSSASDDSSESDEEDENEIEEDTSSQQISGNCSDQKEPGINFDTKNKLETQDAEEKPIEKLGEIAAVHSSQPDKIESTNEVINSSALLSRQDLIDLFKSFKSPDKPCICIGLVGYPNVGKSSSINALLQQKKVSVSTTPGKTKHFQTLYLESSLLLCDCPGLVMPSFVCTKADMVVNGILPVDQLRDHVPPIAHIANVIPRHVLEERYGIMLPPPREGEDPLRPPTADELLSAYAYNRGFMTQRGLPDNSRGARCILKEFVAGKLLYSHAPPGIKQQEYHPFPERSKQMVEKQPPQLRVVRPHKMSTETLDKAFFSKVSVGAHTKGVATTAATLSEPSGSSDRLAGKPWKKHNNRNKKEKLRRVYAHLDKE